MSRSIQHMLTCARQLETLLEEAARAEAEHKRAGNDHTSERWGRIRTAIHTAYTAVETEAQS